MQMSVSAAIAKPESAAQTGRMSTGRLLAINSMWFGQGAHWPPINFVLLPLIAVLVAQGSADLFVSKVSAAGNLFALIAPILAGWLSDRTSTRWGRRRPWILAGTAVNLAGLGLLAVSRATLPFAFAYILVQLSFNLAGGAYAAVIPESVPAPDRGRASGMLGMMNALGSVAGLIAVTATTSVFGESRIGVMIAFAAIAIILAITTVVTLIAVEEPANPVVRHERMSLHPIAAVAAIAGVIAIACWIAFLFMPASPVRLGAGLVTFFAALIAGFTAWQVPTVRGFFAAFGSRDFFWTFATRALVMMGVYTIYPFFALYLRSVVHVHHPNTMAGYWGLAVLIAGIVPALVGGQLSDRWGRRKVFVYAAGGLQAAVAAVLLFGLVTSIPVIFLMGIVFGVGYGLYVAVDWAIASDVLPDREKSAGRDMGLWHVAFTLPPALAPAVFGPILHHFNQTGGHLGYRLVFAGAAVWFVLGTIFVSRIRAIR